VGPHSTFPSTNPFPSEDRLPIIWPGTLFNAGTMIAGLAVVLAWILSSRSTFGLELRALGLGEQAARFAGVRVKRLIVTAMAVAAPSRASRGAWRSSACEVGIERDPMLAFPSRSDTIFGWMPWSIRVACAFRRSWKRTDGSPAAT
jgi:hypothetical protein